MTVKKTIERGVGTKGSEWFDHKQELDISQRLLTSLRYHIRTQDFLSTRRAKQRLVLLITIIVVVLTVIFAVAR